MVSDAGSEKTGEASDAPSVTAVAAIVLAAGKSTRMRSKLPKPLHPICGCPLVVHILEALGGAGVEQRVVVVGHQAEAVRAALDARYGDGTLLYAAQFEQKGTGHAALMAQPALGGWPGTVLIVPGDAPLLTDVAFRTLIAAHRSRGAAATLLTVVLPHDAGAYGRIVRDASGDVQAIVEARDAGPDQLAIREINTGVMAFAAPALFRCLQDLRPDNAQGELYLTDVIGMLRTQGETVGAVVSDDPDIGLGINTRVELAEVGEKMRHRRLRDLMLSGVTVEDPATTFVDAGVTVGQDTTLLPFTRLGEGTSIGEDCVIGPNAHLLRARIGDRVKVRASTVEDATVGDDCRVGPFAHIRPGSTVGAGSKIGNFVELKNATLAENVAAGHLTYLGDATVGARTNVGAGTITCNYDGVRKHRTTVGSDVFVGSDTAFVAPVTVGDGAATAAGSVVTADVPAGALAIARSRQTVKDGWVEARRTARRTSRVATDPDKEKGA